LENRVASERRQQRLDRRRANAWRPRGLAFRVAGLVGVTSGMTVAASRLVAADGIRGLLLQGLLIGAAAGLAYLLTARRLRALGELAAGARRLAAGEPQVKVSESGTLDEVRILARSFNEMARHLDEHRLALEQRNLELVRANETLAQLSITDGLTHLHNHRYFQDQLHLEAKRASRTGAPLCLVLIDIDDFKLLNDRLGHSAGDRVLEEVAQRMHVQIRETDTLARYGGEEFAALLPQTDLEGATALAEKVRLSVGERPFPVIGLDGPVHVSISLGVALFDGEAATTFDAADRSLYEAKANGKDCVVAAKPAPQT
jgi:diguanylate cyclase (GGDEF)-like protein